MKIRMTRLYMLAQVKVLALINRNDQVIYDGIPEVVLAASKFGMRIIPGVEISAQYFPWQE
jgi:3',5'-nucleoside bisphosphate phosphatase